jgi:hypothetical protein
MKNYNTRISFLILLLMLVHSFAGSQVTVTEKLIEIPTYEVLEPDPNPAFYTGRVYQGSQGRIYPYPLYHNLSNKVVNKEYNAVIIENEYTEVCILPDLGGRIYYAKDKSNDYYFIYYNRVIKPGLIGMVGAWTSGGVEWNIPHHHRSTSLLPVDYTVTENENGSKTVWVGETEWRHRSKWVVGVTLHPGNSLVEANIRIYNTTPVQNSILIWANAAVHANENYQVFFPPETEYVASHGKYEFSEWPVSHRLFDRADYSAGVDISMWENHIIRSASPFEWGNKGNFVAGIDHGSQTGTVIFGDKYINPGKNYWTWGNTPSGLMNYNELTENDGPYIELFFGSYSDNQPDYSWMQTLETKESRYWFAPLKQMTGIKRANQNAMIDFEMINDALQAVINVTRPVKNAEILIYNGDQLLYRNMSDMDPDRPGIIELAIAGADKYELRLEVYDGSGNILIAYQPKRPDGAPLPEPVSPPRTAEELNDPDSLYYAGLRFEQLHSAQYMPLDYYLKAIGLKPEHVPSLLRAGIISLKADDIENAARYLEKAVERVTSDYMVPENAAPLYYLALARIGQGKQQEAYKLLYRASWDYGFHSPARYQLAMIDSREGNHDSVIRASDACI